MIETYIQVLYPGIIVSDTSETRVEKRDPENFELPKDAFGFRYFDKEVLDGETGKLYGKEHNHSPWYYRGVECTVEDIKRDEPNSILYRNMVGNDINRVLKTRFGQAIPMKDEDIIVCIER